MTRRFRTAAALTFLAIGAGVATATAAQADTGYHLQATYFYQDECNTIGQQGVANHQWSSYYCTWTPFNPPFTGSGILGEADLYVE